MLTTGFSAHSSNSQRSGVVQAGGSLVVVFDTRSSCGGALRPAAGAQQRREVKSMCRGNRFRHAENGRSQPPYITVA